MLALAASCIATAPHGIERETDVGGSGGETFGTTNPTTSTPPTSSGTTDPHAVLGAVPAHGPFSGSKHVIVHGKGFEPDVRLWFGDQLAEDIIAIDPTRVQVSTPASDPGIVTISAQNGDDDSTLRALPEAYTYDPLYAEPASGPVAGGTVISIYGKNTTWDQDLIEARVDQKPCTTLDVVSAEQLSCTVPKGTPGTKSLTVVTSTGSVTALDAYTYEDSTTGFKGGLSGEPLAGALKVLAYDNFGGSPLAGAHVIVGDNLATALMAQADSSGLAQFVDPSLDQPVTVTVAAECHSPISFVDVPVDTVTVYLNPTLTPQCAGEGDPPPTGGNPTLQGQVRGELMWPPNQEFQKGDWTNIPGPNQDEERIAYVFFATRNHLQSFSLPSATFAVTEESPGDLGYGFKVPAYPGNHAMYAIAGLFNTITSTFHGYAFGAVQGVAVYPGQATESVIIPMEKPLDQALVLSVSPPPPGPKGPDRLNAAVAIEIAQSAFAILPETHKTPLIPLGGPVVFVGLPPLDGYLTGARYITSAQAVTGPSLSAPMSVVGSVGTTTTSIPVDVSGFVAVPELVTPAVNGAWNGTNLAVNFPSGAFPPDLTVYEIVGGGGLVRWIVAVPQANHAIELPDLSGLQDAGIPSGPLVIGVYGARFDDFDYGDIGYGHLRSGGMDAYALDYFNAHL